MNVLSVLTCTGVVTRKRAAMTMVELNWNMRSANAHETSMQGRRMYTPTVIILKWVWKWGHEMRICT